VKFTIIIVFYYFDYKCRLAVDDSFLKAKNVLFIYAAILQCITIVTFVSLMYRSHIRGVARILYLARFKNPTTFLLAAAEKPDGGGW